MCEYIPLTSDIYVPHTWPVATQRLVIIKLVKKAIRDHLFDQRVVITINNVSGLITGGWPRYTLERIEYESDECTCYIDLLLPVKISLLKLKPDGSYLLENNSISFLSEDLAFDHPISRLFGSTGHRIAIATPNLKNILRRMGITGEVYNYTLVTTYRNPKDLVPQQLVQTMVDPYVSVEKIYEDQWNIVCVNSLIKPQQSWGTRNIVQPLMRSSLFRRR